MALLTKNGSINDDDVVVKVSVMIMNGGNDGCDKMMLILMNVHMVMVVMVRHHDDYVTCSDADANNEVKIIVQVQVRSATMLAAPLSFYLPRSLQNSAVRFEVVAHACTCEPDLVWAVANQ